MNIKSIIKCFNYWLNDKSAAEITHSHNYAKYEIERLLSDQSQAVLILQKENMFICKCKYNYVIDTMHSADNKPHLFEFEAIGFSETEKITFNRFTFFDFIITYR